MAYLGWVDANMYWSSIGFVSLDTLNVDDKLLTVNLHHLADLLTFVVASDNLQIMEYHTLYHSQ